MTRQVWPKKIKDASIAWAVSLQPFLCIYECRKGVAYHSTPILGVESNTVSLTHVHKDVWQSKGKTWSLDPFGERIWWLHGNIFWVHVFSYRAESVQIIIRLWGAILTLYYDEMLLLGVASSKMAPRATSMYKNSNRILWPSQSADQFPFERVV